MEDNAEHEGGPQYNLGGAGLDSGLCSRVEPHN